MLQNIRDRAQGWLAWVIVGLLIIPFALWGIQEYLGPSGKVVVAKVDQTEISRNQFEQAVSRQMQVLQQNFGGQDISGLKSNIEQTVLNQIIEEEILWQQADKQGLRIGNQWLAAQIQAIPNFHQNKQFSQEQYESVLSRQGLSPAMFEQDYRRSLTSDQWRKSLLSTALWIESENQYYQALNQQSRQISYIQFSQDRFKDKLEFTDTDLEKFYEEHKANYLSEEQVSIEYVSLATEQLKDNLNISDEGLQSYYEDQIQRFTTPARWKARHILVPVIQGADANTEAVAKAQIDDLLTKIKSSDYDSVEAEWIAAQNDGGDLEFGDWLTEENARPEIFAAIKDLQAGAITEAVRSQFGYHIIHVLNAEAQKVQALVEVHDSLMDEYQKEEARKLFYERAEEFTNLAYENPDNLTLLAEVLDLKIQTTGLFGRMGSDEHDMLKNIKVLKAAFSAKVLQNENSEVLELGEQNYVLIHLKQHKKAVQQDFDMVKDKVREQFIAEKATEAAKKAGTSLLSTLGQGQDAKIELDALQLGWHDPIWIKRQANPDLAFPSLASSAFNMGKLADGKALYQGLFVGNDYIVLALLDIKDGEVNPAQIAANSQASMWGESEFQALLANMRTLTAVDIYTTKTEE